MAQIKDVGIILKSRDFFEADKILTILTPKKGKIKAIAKGIRRPTAKLSGHLELFSVINLILIESRSNLDIIGGAEVISSFKNLRQSLKKTATAYYLAELIDKLIEENEPHLEIFQLLKNAFEKLNSEKKIDLDLLKDYLIINILDILGYRPEIKKCQKCHRPIIDEKNYFSFSAGGIICSKCAFSDYEIIPIPFKTLKILKLFLGYDIDIIDKISTKDKKELDQILELFLEYISEKEFKSLNFYKQINHKES